MGIRDNIFVVQILCIVLNGTDREGIEVGHKVCSTTVVPSRHMEQSLILI
jgi:hypothetical protein